jgi:hypothetical protein
LYSAADLTFVFFERSNFHEPARGRAKNGGPPFRPRWRSCDYSEHNALDAIHAMVNWGMLILSRP